MTVWALLTVPRFLQAQLRGSANYLHKLVAASHIYNLWTDKGADAGALAERYEAMSIVTLCWFSHHIKLWPAV